LREKIDRLIAEPESGKLEIHLDSYQMLKFSPRGEFFSMSERMNSKSARKCTQSEKKEKRYIHPVHPASLLPSFTFETGPTRSQRFSMDDWMGLTPLGELASCPFRGPGKKKAEVDPRPFFHRLRFFHIRIGTPYLRA
jgi:hypothetical protein